MAPRVRIYHKVVAGVPCQRVVPPLLDIQCRVRVLGGGWLKNFIGHTIHTSPTVCAHSSIHCGHTPYTYTLYQLSYYVCSGLWIYGLHSSTIHACSPSVVDIWTTHINCHRTPMPDIHKLYRYTL